MYQYTKPNYKSKAKRDNYKINGACYMTTLGPNSSATPRNLESVIGKDFTYN